MSESSFTIQEQEEFNKASNSFNLDTNTKQYAHKLIKEYKNKVDMVFLELFN